MGVKFFGQFLLELGVITREQLLASTQLQEDRNRPLGSYAVEKGYLSPAQAEQINRAQQSTDRRFGELALELGLMTQPQIEDVLSLQRAGRIRIGEALLELKCLAEPELTTQLAAFEADQAIYKTGQVELPSDTPDRELAAVCIDLTEKLLLRVGGLLGKRGAPLFTGVPSPASALTTVRIPFSGRFSSEYAVSVSSEVALSIARRVLGAGIVISEELALDALKEFCNVVCGNVCAKLSQAERPLEIGPPEDGIGAPHESRQSLLVPLHLPDGTFELRLYWRR